MTSVWTVFAAWLATLSFSVSVICGHRAASRIGGIEANFWRLSVAAVLLGGWSAVYGAGLADPALPLFLVSGVIGIGLGDLAFYSALPRLGPRLTSLLVQCFSAPAGAAIEWLWLGTRISTTQILFCVLTLTGVGVALHPGHHKKFSRQALILGLLLAMVSAIGTASGAVLSRKAYGVSVASGLALSGPRAAFQRVLGGVGIAALTLLILKRDSLANRTFWGSPGANAASKKWRGTWYWVVLNGTMGQAVGVSCMQWALQNTPTGVVLAIISVTPITVIPLACIFERERPGWLSVIGALLGVAGAIGLAFS